MSNVKKNKSHNDELEKKLKAKYNQTSKDEDYEDDKYEDEDIDELEEDEEYDESDEDEIDDDEEYEDDIEDDEDDDELEDDDESDEDEEEDDIEEDDEESKIVKTKGNISMVVSKKSKKNTVPQSNTFDLSSMKVDLNNIIINKNDRFKTPSYKEEIFKSRATTQVVCCQSGYVAHLSALKNQEMQNIINYDGDLYNTKKYLYKAVHKHLEDTSTGRMGFEEFMKNTSYFDMETLLYGIFNQTFPYENTFRTQCNKPDCGKETSVTVNNNTLVEARGDSEETYAKLQEIINAPELDAKRLYEQSIIHKVKRVMLDDCKIIVDIVIPSIYDYLENTLKNTNPQFLSENASAVGMSIFVSQILIPDIDEMRRTGQPVYIPLETKNEKISTIADLPYDDSLQLNDAITEFTDKYKITYSIKGVRCQHCGDIMDPISVSMEELLFRRIRLGRQGKRA